MRDERERIIDILEAIDKIEKYATSGKDAAAHSFGIDADVVWTVIENDLPDLKNKITKILDSDYM